MCNIKLCHVIYWRSARRNVATTFYRPVISIVRKPDNRRVIAWMVVNWAVWARVWEVIWKAALPWILAANSIWYYTNLSSLRLYSNYKLKTIYSLLLRIRRAFLFENFCERMTEIIWSILTLCMLTTLFVMRPTI